MKLNKQVWHGRYYEQGTEVLHHESPIKQSDIRDEHGCKGLWMKLASNPKDILNVWECEVSK